MPRAYHVFLKSKSVLFLPQCHGFVESTSGHIHLFAQMAARQPFDIDTRQETQQDWKRWMLCCGVVLLRSILLAYLYEYHSHLLK